MTIVRVEGMVDLFITIYHRVHFVLACHTIWYIYLSQIRNPMHAPVEIVYGYPKMGKKTTFTSVFKKSSKPKLDLRGNLRRDHDISGMGKQPRRVLAKLRRRLTKISNFCVLIHKNMMRAFGLKRYAAGLRDRVVLEYSDID